MMDLWNAYAPYLSIAILAGYCWLLTKRVEKLETLCAKTIPVVGWFNGEDTPGPGCR